MDVERTIELITARLQQVAELQLQLAERQSGQQETVDLLVTPVGQLRDHAEHTDRRLEEMDRRWQEMGQRMERGFQELREAQQETRQNLNDLIKIVDDLIRRDGKGR